MPLYDDMFLTLRRASRLRFGRFWPLSEAEKARPRRASRPGLEGRGERVCPSAFTFCGAASSNLYLQEHRARASAWAQFQAKAAQASSRHAETSPALIKMVKIEKVYRFAGEEVK